MVVIVMIACLLRVLHVGDSDCCMLSLHLMLTVPEVVLANAYVEDDYLSCCSISGFTANLATVIADVAGVLAAAVVMCWLLVLWVLALFAGKLVMINIR